MATPNQQLVIVTGKGGVGKSAVAGALAFGEAQKGKRVLLVELGERSQFQHWYDMKIGYEPTNLAPNLDVAIWDGDTSLREYIQHLIKLGPVADLFFDNPIMKTFVGAAPALRELALMGKFTSAVRQMGPELPYDLIVMDCYSTGHFLATLRAPLGMAKLIEFGPMGQQSRHIHEILMDPKVTKYVVVTLPEELPVSEALELNQTLRSEFSVKPITLCNRWVQSSLNSSKLQSSEQQVDDFINYLSAVFSRQETSDQHLLAELSEFQKTPLVFEPNAQDVIQSLSHWYQQNAILN